MVWNITKNASTISVAKINIHFTSQIGANKQQNFWQRSRLDDKDESFLSNNIASFLWYTCSKSVVKCKSYIFVFHNLLLLYYKFSIPEELYYISTYTLCQVHHFPGFSEVSFTLLQRLRKSSKQQPVVLRTYVYTMYRFF